MTALVLLIALALGAGDRAARGDRAEARTMSPLARQRYCALRREQGECVREIAEELRTSETTVRRALRDWDEATGELEAMERGRPARVLARLLRMHAA